MRRNTELDVRRIAWEVAQDAVRPHAAQVAIGESASQLVRNTAHEVATQVTRHLLDQARIEADEVRRIAGAQGAEAGAANARVLLDDVRTRGSEALEAVRLASTAAIAEVRTDSRALLHEVREGSAAALEQAREGTSTACREAQQGTAAALAEVRESTEAAVAEVRGSTETALTEVRKQTTAVAEEARRETGAAVEQARRETGAALAEARQETDAAVEQARGSVQTALAEVRQATGAAVEEARREGGAVLREVRETAGTAVRELRAERTEATEAIERTRQEATDAIEHTRQETHATVRAMLDAGREALRESVHEEAARLVAEVASPVLEVVLPEGERTRLEGPRHEVLPDLLTALNARCHVLLVGPAGTGKSMMAKQAAEALGLEFQALSLGPTTPMSKIFGYYDAHGHYHATPFRRAFEHGGLMLLDELDSGHPGLLAELNQALAIGTCAFADGMVTAHQNFRLVATANTYGTGGDRQYVGRQALDAATLDRFLVMEVPVDEALEEKITLAHAPSRTEEAWEILEEVRRLRELAAEQHLPVMFSPRASIDAAKLLQAGASVEQALQWRVVRGMSAAHRSALGVEV